MSSLLPYLGSGPHDAASSQYYSVTDYRDILRRATELHVQVIPEIDMPGHMHAAIQSMRVRTAKLKSQGWYNHSSRQLYLFLPCNSRQEQEVDLYHVVPPACSH